MGLPTGDKPQKGALIVCAKGKTGDGSSGGTKRNLRRKCDMDTG